MKQFWGKTWSFFINLIHSFISYGIAAVQRPSHPSLHSCLGWVLNIYCKRRDVAGIVVDRGERCSPAAWDQKQGFPQLLNSTQLCNLSGIKWRWRCVVMQVWGGGLENIPSFSGLVFPFPGEKICCLVGRKQSYPLMAATLDTQSRISGFFFRNDITSPTHLRIAHASSSCPFAACCL